MKSSVKYLAIIGFILLANIATFKGVNCANECGNVSVDGMAFKMAPCISASQDANSRVTERCCSAIEAMGKNPTCLCAVMLSNTAKLVGVKPEIAVTIPKRCAIADRPIGYKCGAYTLP